MTTMKKSHKLAMLFFVSVIMARQIAFVADNAGIEHDSGWYIGVARNLALRGIYASYTNTALDENPISRKGIFVHPVIQDGEGYSYFTPRVTVGPGYVVPQALLLKIFGHGFWQYRLWPMICFGLLLLFGGLFVYERAGVRAMSFFYVWLWFVPALYILAHEAFSEPIAALFILLSIFSFDSGKRRYDPGVSGALLGMAVLTKTVSLLAMPAFVLVLGWNYYQQRIKGNLIRTALWFGGFVAPIVLFQLYRFVSLFRQGGLDAFRASNLDEKLTYECCGSGLDVFSNGLNGELIGAGLRFLVELGIPSLSGWGAIVLAGMYFLKRGKPSDKVSLLMIGTFLLWFVFLSRSWARWIWPVYFMVLIYFSVLIVFCWDSPSKTLRAAGVGVFLFTFVWSMFTPRVHGGWSITNDDYRSWVPLSRERAFAGLPTHHVIVSKKDQQAFATAMKTLLKPEDRIYYMKTFMSAEASALVDRVFFPLERVEKQSPSGKRYLIFGPYQIAWSPPRQLFAKVKQLCRALPYQNRSYRLCELK
jgi:hypothetical protein